LVLRGLGLTNLLAGIAFGALGARVVLYTQGALLRPYVPLRLRILAPIVFDWLGWGWFSPVQQRGIDSSGESVDARIKFIPFAKYPSPKAYVRRKGERLKLLSVGKFNRRKNHEAVIAAIADITEATLTIAGECREPHQEEYLIELRGLADKLAPGRVVFAPNTPHAEMEELYLRHDVLALCSYDEPASFSQLEAMAYGLAVICNRDNGTASYVQHRQSGFVVDGSVSRIAEVVKSYAEQPDLLPSHSAFGLVLLRESHSPARVIQSIQQV
jgi:glycosyltransferase involved in cell wall biosynthesis